MSEAEMTAILLSLKVAGLALVITLPVAILVGYLLAKKRFWGHSLLNVVVLLPLVMPPVVTGYLLLIVFGRNGSVGSALYHVFGVRLAFEWTGAALAAAIMAFPLIVRPIRQAFEAVDPNLEAAARSLGASEIRRFFTVSLPLALPGLVAGAVLGFAKALGEFGATITFAANIPGKTQTMTLAIFTGLQAPGGEAVALRLTLVSLGLAVVAVFLSEIFMARMARKTKRTGLQRVRGAQAFLS